MPPTTTCAGCLEARIGVLGIMKLAFPPATIGGAATIGLAVPAWIAIGGIATGVPAVGGMTCMYEAGAVLGTITCELKGGGTNRPAKLGEPGSPRFPLDAINCSYSSRSMTPSLFTSMASNMVVCGEPGVLSSSDCHAEKREGLSIPLDSGTGAGALAEIGFGRRVRYICCGEGGMLRAGEVAGSNE